MSIRDFNPKVTIVIPVYNGSNYLREAIDSALAQTYKNIEVVVIDDGSNDVGATERIATSYQNRIRYYKKENGGVASALNFGIKKMTGEYFSWLSHDDMYEKTKIEDQVNYLYTTGGADTIIASNVKILYASGIKKKEKINVAAFNFVDIFLATSAQVGLNGCSLLIPKKAFDICGTFDTSLPVTQDYDLWFKLKDRYRFVLLDKYLVVSRRHAEQDSVKKRKLMIEAGDKLHSNFLSKISYKRFDEYFKNNKRNIKHAYDNYKVYKLRGYKKTSSMILKNILKYYHENDTNRFYSIFNLELETASGGGLAGMNNSNKPTDADRSRIDREYSALVNSGTNNYPMRESVTFSDVSYRKSMAPKLIRRLRGSVKQDGIYLTGEKMARKMYKRLTKSGR